MHIQIKHRYTEAILHEGDYNSILDALSAAIKSGADLRGANLSGANLGGAKLSGANLTGAINGALVVAQTRILPEGDLIGYKKCSGSTIVKLKIPANAKRSHAFGRKCRAEYVEVLEVFGAESATSLHEGKAKYEPGKIVRCDKWSENWQEECAGGIHFFITRLEAENY